MVNNLRFLTQDQYNELIGFYHLANVALAGTCPKRYDKMLWATKEFAKKYPGISATAAYKDLDTNMNF